MGKNSIIDLGSYRNDPDSAKTVDVPRGKSLEISKVNWNINHELQRIQKRYAFSVLAA